MPNYMPYPNMYQQPQMQVPGTQMSLQQPQIQNGGFVSVRNEDEARNYPVAPGNSITFKNEMAPYVYTKTMGFSQLDRPIFEKFRLVKEEVTEASNLPQNGTTAPQTSIPVIDELKSEIEAIWSEIEGIKNDRSKSEVAPRRTNKRDKDGDD